MRDTFIYLFRIRYGCYFWNMESQEFGIQIISRRNVPTVPNLSM